MSSEKQKIENSKAGNRSVGATCYIGKRRKGENIMKLKWVKVIWLLFRNKRFRNILLETLLYALRNYDKNRGEGAADVLEFENFYYRKVVDFTK